MLEGRVLEGRVLEGRKEEIRVLWIKRMGERKDEIERTRTIG